MVIVLHVALDLVLGHFGHICGSTVMVTLFYLVRGLTGIRT